jgi:hypothetical protein
VASRGGECHRVWRVDVPYSATGSLATVRLSRPTTHRRNNHATSAKIGSRTGRLYLRT